MLRVIKDLVRRMTSSLLPQLRVAEELPNPSISFNMSRSSEDALGIRTFESADSSVQKYCDMSDSSKSMPAVYEVAHMGPPGWLTTLLLAVLFACFLVLAASASTSKPKKGSRKVILKPGHSLTHWVDRTKCGEDMTNLGGSCHTRVITKEELAQHCSVDDAWMCVRGKVIFLEARPLRVQ